MGSSVMHKRKDVILIWLTVAFLAWCGFTSMNRPNPAPEHVDIININDWR